MPTPRAGRDTGLRRFLLDRTGSVAALVGLMMPVLVGAMGLGTEVGYWYLTQRRLQAAADVAAHGAAREKAEGGSGAVLQTMAEYLVQQAGFDLGDTTVTVNDPPFGGSYAGDGTAVEVVVAESVPRIFSAIFQDGPVPISARAVARTEASGHGCVLALSKNADGAITIAGSSEATLSLCDMVSNSAGAAFVMSGNGSSVSANCVQTVGTAEPTGNLTVNCDHLREHASAVDDPFADIAEPELVGDCQSGSVGENGTATEVTPTDAHPSGMVSRRYCNGLDVRGTVVFDPGLYLIEGGDFTINSNAEISGDGVVFYLADGVSLLFNGTATVDLSAPSSGPYAGILVFGSRTATGVEHVINGNLGSSLDGAIYAAASHLTVSGSAETAANGCTQFVTDTVTFSGSGTINISCENPDGASIETTGSTTLVE